MSQTTTYMETFSTYLPKTNQKTTYTCPTHTHAKFEQYQFKMQKTNTYANTNNNNRNLAITKQPKIRQNSANTIDNNIQNNCSTNNNTNRTSQISQAKRYTKSVPRTFLYKQ